MATKVNKFLKWLEQTGLSNLGLIIAALMCFFIGYLPQSVLSVLGIILLTIAVVINWQVIWKLIKNEE